MNQALLKEIVSHVFATFAVIPSDFVNQQSTQSLMSPEYLLDDQVSFIVDNTTVKNKVWGCQMDVTQHQIKVLLADCDVAKDVPEFAMIVQPKDLPMYGLYLVCWEDSDPGETIKDYEPMLATSLDQGKNWMPLNTSLQATFLAGMEQARELNMTWTKIQDHKPTYQAMLSFLRFCDSEA